MSSIEASRMTRSALSKEWSRMLLMAALETQHSKNRWEEVSGCLPHSAHGVPGSLRVCGRWRSLKVTTVHVLTVIINVESVDLKNMLMMKLPNQACSSKIGSCADIGENGVHDGNLCHLKLVAF
jgi:hypothetical protein